MGCLTEPVTPGITVSDSQCFAANTVDASDKTKYRHFAVDDANQLVYYCDRNAYLKELLCYYSNRTAGDNHWTGR